MPIGAPRIAHSRQAGCRGEAAAEQRGSANAGRAPYFAGNGKNTDLQHKLTAFIEETRCRSSVHLTLVTTYALARNEYSGHVQSVVTMDDLFSANSR